MGLGLKFRIMKLYHRSSKRECQIRYCMQSKSSR